MKRTFDLDLNRRPVVALADEYPAGFVDNAHSHERIQLLYASSGVMSVVTDATSFVIPPQRAVWIPSRIKHEVSCRGPVSLRTLYIDPQYERDDPECHIVEVGPLLKALALGWVWFFRGTPIYTQLVFWGLFALLFPRLSISIPFGPELIGIDSRWLVTPAVAAVVGLGFNESAYLTEIFRAGFRAVDRGQAEAAQALGMSGRKIWLRILLPQAMRTIIPPTSNETIGMLKMTSLVLAIPFTLDLMFATSAIANRTFLPVPLLMVAAVWYLFITSVLMVGQYFLERHYGRGHDIVASKGGPM